MRAPLLVVIVVLTTLVTPFRRELYVGDETKYSQVVREMRAGSWFVPTLEGSPFTHKPPLHFWIVATLTLVFGVYSVWPFVIPSLIAFALLLWLLWKWEGAMAAFVCGTAIMVWGSAQSARMDIEFTALLALAAWWIARFFERDDFRALLLAGIAVGIAILVKGPMAPVIAVCLVLFEWLRRRRIPRGNYFPAIAAMIVIPLLWFGPAIAIGGEAFWNEIFFKQTVGRAVGAWVHRSPPWFYVLRAPATLFPWFFLLVAALFTPARKTFYASWILAVVVPYSLLSSKLDVYMIAAIPPVALLIATYLRGADETWGRRANAFVLALLAVIGVVGATMASRWIKEPDRALAELPSVRGLFIVLAVGAVIGLVIALRGRLIASTIAVGFVPIAALVYVALVLTPLANDQASTQPLVRAITRQNVPAAEVACFVCPHLWVRDMPRALEQVKLVDAEELRAVEPRVLVVRRKNVSEVDVSGYRKVDEFRMIGKWFDVYRR